jgi:hypothetical protein
MSYLIFCEKLLADIERTQNQIMLIQSKGFLSQSEYLRRLVHLPRSALYQVAEFKLEQQ